MNVTHLGVDVRVIRKRVHYGSILIGLNTNKPIDLLKDRKENTFYQLLMDIPFRLFKTNKYS
ncbi:MAG: hypothetical protein LBI72_06705 [Flavobacteriaceae bacterium]|nr:hypothetical protein [Flavobacteriaceae bacterium]